MFSPEFLSWTGLALCLLVASGVIIATARAVKVGSTYRDIEGVWAWIKPSLVTLGAIGVAGGLFSQLNGWVVFTLTFVLGLLCGLTSSPPFLALRDATLSVCAVLLTVAVVANRMSEGLIVGTVLLTFIGAAATGLALGGLGRILNLMNGLALFGGVEFLDFLMSPFGVPFYSQASAYTVPIGFAAALLFGLCVRFRPVFTLSLCSTATAALGVTFQIFLWFEKKNNPSAQIGRAHV